MSDKFFNIGDSVWIASFESKAEQIPCPVCFGSLKVTLILGNGDQIILPCEYCGKGYDGPRGYIKEYQCIPRSESVTITAKETHEGDGKTEIRYYSHGRIYEAKDVFETQEGAMVAAREWAILQEEKEKTRANYLKANVNLSYSWNAGYHLQNAKRERQSAEYHEGKAILCRQKVKK